MAVDKVKALNPDVVILDLSMPVMNGLLAAKYIASIAPRILMIMFTMHTAEPLVREAKKAGIRRVVSKSDGAAFLLSSVTELLSQPQAS
jgi:DNA-binding NarL/FixJ family response regulator